MAGNGLDIQKLLAMQAQTQGKVEPLTDVKITILEIPYITKTNNIERRTVKLFIPKKTKLPMPLIYIPHYEMEENSIELRAYLKHGWAVACCAPFKGEYNAQITDDNLVFNNAALYTLRNLAEIDNNRIAVVGGSAGGYMSLMLNALQLGICVSIANGPICNIYFNINKYFEYGLKLNLATIASLKEEEKKDVVTLLSKLPIPFLGALAGGFLQVRANFPDLEDMQRWEAFSPTALCECFCNPLYITCCTSDILVPIDQITKRFTYDKNGDSLPVDFNCRLPADIKGKLKYSLEERLPKDEVNIVCKPVTVGGPDMKIEFDESKRFQIYVCDEGAPESYCSHNKGLETGRIDDTPYIAAMFEKGAGETNILTPEKLLMFAQRYEGNSIQLPAHTGIDDTVYGSLVVYRKELLDELKKWYANNGEAVFNEIYQKAIVQAPSFKQTLKQISLEIKGK